ncbi:MAG TPA: bifunctional 5,10-methylenetetrahydrofolate dehydrogenase/5,10-methenyltetrahydrofolate cyclohydrolase [Candidatus Omnitrophota bacterium]|nr:bifunctional 5,10-methylenetetrahydrofolate dehydrogenase/5,10-methenyltetrahydrofolate cyclohydrolase [Candidatus Omnitrophota bacterium]HSA30926.1 bifunctional 5,10-methylenetetrahydrofolate dehydrogenase/5,10-methenyltetrahydrofolate cyclohydrolase [Candidatus Omnitrophota bacterium]
MFAEVLDGRLLAEQIREHLKKEVAELQSRTGAAPHVVNIVLGGDPGSEFYAKSQAKAAEDVGISYERIKLDPALPEEKFLELVHRLNADKRVTGIIINKPLPPQISEQKVANSLDLYKDIEGLNAANIGNVVLGKSKLIPCTAAAVMEHVRASGIDLRGKEVVVVGASAIVGKPLALLFVQHYATVTLCHIGTSEAGRLKDHVSRADVLVVAVGRPHLITGDMVKEGAVVIDVGINKKDNKIVGDVDYESVSRRASKISPVPGGVGPVTVMMLMRNAVLAYRLQREV